MYNDNTTAKKRKSSTAASNCRTSKPQSINRSTDSQNCAPQRWRHAPHSCSQWLRSSCHPPRPPTPRRPSPPPSCHGQRWWPLRARQRRPASQHAAHGDEPPRASVHAAGLYKEELSYDVCRPNVCLEVYGPLCVPLEVCVRRVIARENVNKSNFLRLSHTHRLDPDRGQPRAALRRPVSRRQREAEHPKHAGAKKREDEKRKGKSERGPRSVHTHGPQPRPQKHTRACRCVGIVHCDLRAVHGGWWLAWRLGVLMAVGVGPKPRQSKILTGFRWV